MDQLLKFIIDETSKGNIKKETAIQFVKQVKQADIKEADDIAIIGMSGKMPLADNVDAFWENIESGLDCITPFPDARSKDITAYLRATGERNIAYNKNGFLEEIDKFDYKFFRLSLKEASLMDPHQRLFLETAWGALEDAGYGGQKAAASNTGVYVGFASSLRDMYLKQIYEVEPNALPLSMVGNLPAVLPSRISYLLDLRGPSMVIDTACSSSLVAVNLACEALRNGKCDMAIAGGVKINLVPLDHELMKIGIESSDGRTRAFNDVSDGAGIGEGVCAIVLKPLKKALKDGDSIYAVIKGVAMNQDGNSVGLTAPNPAAQTDVILKAWADAKVEPETITYVETHGTGTKLGDPIEVKGIQDAFRKFTNKTQFCAIGSLKTNIGHSSEPAGLISLIKTVLALRHKKLPPSLNFNRPNRAIRFNESPVYVNTKLREWHTPEGTPRRGGVSSFGISGTNCHVVLEEAPAVAHRQPEAAPFHLLALSAKSESALQQLCSDYANIISTAQESDLANVCYTANTGRGHYSHRLGITFSNRAELIQKLSRITSFPPAEADGILYGVHKVVGSQGAAGQVGALTEQEKIALDLQATQLLKQRTQGGELGEEQWRQISTVYIKGADINWDNLYDPNQHTRLHLPAYPFERTRCWIELPDIVEDVQETEDQFYSVLWKQNPAVREPEQGDWQEKTVLIFKDARGLWSQFADRLRSGSERLLFVEYGEAFAQPSEDTYVISRSADDYHRLVAALGEGEISRILHLASITGETEIDSYEALQASQQQGVYSIFHMLCALVGKGFDQNVNLTVIAENVYKVTGEEGRICPENAPLLGIGKAINHEHPGIRVRCIDIDSAVDIDELLAQMQDQSETYQVAYRNGIRYTEVFSEIDIEQADDQLITIKEDGVYLITGGLGGIGLEVSKSFARNNRVRLAMVNRTAMPERSAWEEILASGVDPKMQKRIEAIMQIEATGSQVLCYNADIADLDAMQRIIADLKERFGRIDGIIHGAGVPGDGFLFKKTQEAFEQVLLPKVFGTWVLDRLTAAEELDFLVLFSSGLSILSEPGHGDYTAANSYLDSYAAHRNLTGRKTLAINWSTWKETGMAVDYGFNYDSIFKAILTEEALAGLDAVMNKQLDGVLIGEFSYNPQFLHLMDRLPFKLSDKIRTKCQRILDENGKQMPVRKQRPAGKSDGKVELVGKDGEQFSDVELNVAKIYNEILGFSEINIYDSFFELGGDSVMLNRMLVLLEEVFPGQVKLIDLFNYTSVATLSEFITSKGEPEPEAQQVGVTVEDYADMLDEMEKGNLSIDEIIKNMA